MFANNTIINIRHKYIRSAIIKPDSEQINQYGAKLNSINSIKLEQYLINNIQMENSHDMVSLRTRYDVGSFTVYRDYILKKDDSHLTILTRVESTNPLGDAEVLNSFIQKNTWYLFNNNDPDSTIWKDLSEREREQGWSAYYDNEGIGYIWQPNSASEYKGEKNVGNCPDLKFPINLINNKFSWKEHLILMINNFNDQLLDKNLVQELRDYLYDIDRDGLSSKEEIDGWDIMNDRVILGDLNDYLTYRFTPKKTGNYDIILRHIGSADVDITLTIESNVNSYTLKGYNQWQTYRILTTNLNGQNSVDIRITLNDNDDLTLDWVAIKNGDYQLTRDADDYSGSSGINLEGEIEILTRTDYKFYTKVLLFMVYLDGDNDLEGPGIEDINEMEEVGSTFFLNIVVQFDRIPQEDNTNGDWTGTRRYYITQDNDQNIINSQLLQDLGEVNMGNPQSLIDFVNWAHDNYPKTNTYVLILWDHGGGIDGVCRDDTENPVDFITMDELQQAMNSIRDNIGEEIDILGFDACLMQMIEISYQVRNTANIIIGSEETIPSDGYPYNDILDHLEGTSQTDISDFASIIIDDYISSYNSGSQGNDQDATLSAFWLDNIADEITHAVDDFAQNLINGMTQWKQEIRNARENTEAYSYDEYRDLYDFAFEIRQRINDSNIQNSAQNLMNAIDRSRIAERHLTGHPDSYGLSIYWPTQSEYGSSYESLDFALNTHWDEFLKEYYK